MESKKEREREREREREWEWECRHPTALNIARWRVWGWFDASTGFFVPGVLAEKKIAGSIRRKIQSRPPFHLQISPSRLLDHPLPFLPAFFRFPFLPIPSPPLFLSLSLFSSRLTRAGLAAECNLYGCLLAVVGGSFRFLSDNEMARLSVTWLSNERVYGWYFNSKFVAGNC